MLCCYWYAVQLPNGYRQIVSFYALKLMLTLTRLQLKCTYLLHSHLNGAIMFMLNAHPSAITHACHWKWYTSRSIFPFGHFASLPFSCELIWARFLFWLLRIFLAAVVDFELNIGIDWIGKPFDMIYNFQFDFATRFAIIIVVASICSLFDVSYLVNLLLFVRAVWFGARDVVIILK